jgi:2-polyprenyl-3-methyl-5-hydroxy-6-metoxy-1,4-benzoquinol methylase
MNPSEIAKTYDQLADKWNSDEFPRDNGIAPYKHALAFLKEKRRALDIGCGSSGRIIDLLIREGFDVEGLDISSRTCLSLLTLSTRDYIRRKLLRNFETREACRHR